MGNNPMWNIELAEYIKQGGVSKVEKAKAWSIAIGLQAVDGLIPSNYLIELAKEHIEGIIDITEVKEKIDKHYAICVAEDDTKAEADKVSLRIAEVLIENAFHFSVAELLNIHGRLFEGILKNAGEFRNYNITKKEEILDGDTVIYSSYDRIKETLTYDLEQERNFSYKDLTIDEAIKHLTRFVANIWQVHPFGEGNTRTIAVFIIRYLRTFGFEINKEAFANNSLYFRNALVRANYTNFTKNIFENTTYLEKFFSNLLKKTEYELSSIELHILNDNLTKEELTSNSNLTLEEQAIINIIKAVPETTQVIIANKIGKSLRNVKTRMKQMQEKGLIERINSKKTGEWRCSL